MRASRAALAALLLAAAIAPAARGAELGTLFFTPAEREEMDRLRRGEPAQAAAPARDAGGHAVTGYVKRTDGRATVWIDGRPISVSDPKAERLLDPRAVSAYSRSADDVKLERKR